MRRCLLLAAAACVLAPAAFAHAFLKRSDPPVGSELPVAPAAVTLTFTERVEPGFSTIEVLDSLGTRVDKADLHPVASDGDRFSVSLTALAAGQYTVIWHVTSTDTHKTEGRFAFSVSP